MAPNAKPTAVIQTRMGSTRMAGKVLRELVGKPMLWHVVERVRATPGLGQVVVATTVLPEDDAIRDFCTCYDVSVYSGSSEDVLDRYYQAALAFGADPIVRITSDCPVVDPTVVGRLLQMFAEGNYDHVGVAIGGGAAAAGLKGYPDGLDAECFSLGVLERAWREATDQPDREHVTSYIWRNKDLFRTGALEAPQDYSELRLTVDEPEDFQLAERLYDVLYRPGQPPFGLADVLRVLSDHPELAELNRKYVGHEKYRDLWKAASPEGNEMKEPS